MLWWTKELEFWIAKCINQGINVGIAPRSSLLDTDVGTKDKLYGYHRLDNPKVTFQDEKGVIKVGIWSDISNKNQQNNDTPVGIIGRKDLKPVEPNKY